MNKLIKEFYRFIDKQFKKRHPEYSILMQEHADKFNICHDLLFVDAWKKYYLGHKDELEQKFEFLYQNLDEKSIKEAELFFNRNVHLLPSKKHLVTDSLLVNKNEIFTQEELNDHKTYNALYPSYKKNYWLPNNLIPDHSVFGLHHGLIYLSEDVLKRIENKDVFDIGAFVGDFGIVINEYNPKTVHCFEPIKNNYDLMQQTIKMNNLTNIKTYNFGIGDCNNEVLVNGDANIASFNKEFFTDNNLNSKIQLRTLDSFEAENSLNIGLIKIDIEGFELECIQNSINTIKKHKPIMLISIYHHPKDFFEIKPLLENLDLGYKFMIKKTNPFSLVYELMLIAY